MLSAINTKILLAIFAALTIIGGAAIYQRTRQARESRRHPPATTEGRGRTEETGRSLPAAGRAEQEETQLCRRTRGQDLENVPAIAIPTAGLRECEYARDCSISPSTSEREFRCELAIPVHEQPHQSDDPKRRSADPARTHGTECHFALCAYQHGHQLEYHRHDASVSTPSRYASAI